MLREADALPSTGSRALDDQRHAALVEDARTQQRRWSCPAVCRERAPLEPDLAAEAEHVARVTGTVPVDTCPLACARYPNAWVAEITWAVALAGDCHVPVTETLGRELTNADLCALKALRNAQHDAGESDRKIAEQRRARSTRGGA